MTIKLWAIGIFCLLSLSLYSQKKVLSAKGSVIDTAVNVALLNTSISILNAKDSTLVKFTRADAKGFFQFDNLKPGKYILLATYPKYADYVERFKLDTTEHVKDFGKVNMLLKANLLKEAIVKGTIAAIKIKGDTTEYNAGSFTVAANAKVEDLLKQLPGIQVDKDGKITAQGETVSKVLVDGEEFFGDDPTLVTKNLRADMVDKVQLYDKKSDQAAFTGIDDGIKNKTLNIKLKEDKKQGYFGKVDAGGASDEYYSGQAMFNAFKAKRKIAAYGTVANTGKTGLGWEDSNKYGSSTTEMMDNGGLMISGGRDEIYYNGQGIPEAQTGGVHYEGKWNKDKESINANYKTGALGIDGLRTKLSQTSLPNKTADNRDTVALFNNDGRQFFNNHTFRQKIDATYQLKIDSTSNLKVVLDGSMRETRSNDRHFGQNSRGNNILQNKSDRTVNNEGLQKSFYGNIFYNKKLKKKGRTFSINVSETYSTGRDDGDVYSLNSYFDAKGQWTRDSILDQTKNTSSKSTSFNSNATYTEPLNKKWSLILNYGFNVSNSNSDRKSFNKSVNGKYDDLDSLYSNNFDYDLRSHQGGLMFNYKKDKATLNFGAKLDQGIRKQVDLMSSYRFNQDYTNLNPQLSYQYRFNQYKSFRFNYNGSTQQPSIGQIQPVRVNTDPLNVYLGNSALKASFRSSLNANYNSFKVLTDRYISVGINYSFNLNQIISSTVTDTVTGANTHASLNLNNKLPSNFSVYANLQRKVKALGFNIGINVRTNGYRSFNYVNNVLNTLQSNNYFAGLTFSKYVAKKYDFYVNLGPSYNTNTSSLGSFANNNGKGGASRASFTIYLPGKWEVRSDYDYTLTGKTPAFNQNVDYMIWNSTVSKKFLKGDALKISISGNDLLNQNTGFRRAASGNSFSESNYNTIQRFFMLSASWDFNKMGGGLKAKN